jgi:mono/diheme cytochrome c family protein
MVGSIKMQNSVQIGRSLAVLITLLILHLTQTIAADEAQITKGKDLYNQNCVFCHQADAIGKVGFAPSLTNPEFLANASDIFILGTIRDGRQGTGMPPFAHLGRDGIKAVVAYFRSHSNIPNKSVSVDKQDVARGDPRLGEIWFDQICSTCHGVNGDGYATGGTGTAIGNASFLNKASDGFIRETIKQGRTGTRMRGFSGANGLANLDDQEIDDIIVYMRSFTK